MSGHFVPFLVGFASSLAAAAVFAFIAWSRGWLVVSWRDYSRGRALAVRLQGAGVVNFYSCRADYAKYREAPTLIEYLSLAEKSIDIVAYWMSQGIEMEGTAERIAEMVRPPKNLTIRIATIDPTASYVESLAAHLGVEVSELKMRVQSSLARLWSARETLSSEEKLSFTIGVYESTPVASVIMLDAGESTGRLQIDVKPFGAPRSSSFSFELSGTGHPLYETCRKSWSSLLGRVTAFDPRVHLAGFHQGKGAESGDSGHR